MRRRACADACVPSLGHALGGGISGSSVFNLLWNSYTIFQMPRTIPHSRQSCTGPQLTHSLPTCVTGPWRLSPS